MNSTIDAPRLSTTKASDEIEKFRPKSRLIFSEARGRTLLVCEDSYGSLKIEKFIKRLDEVYLLGAGKAINLTREKGGAGLGCMIIFENCSALYLGVLEGIMTTITVEIPTKLNAKQRELVGKSVHLVRK